MEAFRLTELPSAVYYISEFITEEEEQTLLNKVYAAPKPKWVTLSRRRLQNWGGVPSKNGTILEPLPDWLTWPIQRMVEQGVFPADAPANHCLVNEYLPGQGIMPHEDGPFYLPCVATISLGSYTVLDLYPPRSFAKTDQHQETGDPDDNEDHSYSRQPISLVLERRSLFVQCDQVYRTFMHGISERTHDNFDELADTFLIKPPFTGQCARETRVSLTYRRVAKAIRAPFMFRR